MSDEVDLQRLDRELQELAQPAPHFEGCWTVHLECAHALVAGLVAEMRAMARQQVTLDRMLLPFLLTAPVSEMSRQWDTEQAREFARIVTSWGLVPEDEHAYPDGHD